MTPIVNKKYGVKANPGWRKLSLLTNNVFPFIYTVHRTLEMKKGVYRCPSSSPGLREGSLGKGRGFHCNIRVMLSNDGELF
jgi:hypothetical protein